MTEQSRNLTYNGESDCAPQAPKLASTQLLRRGPGRKLTRGWVKIVVDIRLQALRLFIQGLMFVCCAIRMEYIVVFGTDVLLRDGILHLDVSKRIKQICLRRTPSWK
jgi:hypothetical protein